MLAEVALLACESIVEATDAFEAEQWASDLLGTMRQGAPPGEPVEPELFPLFVAALEAVGTAHALAALRALSAVGAPHTSAAADRLAADGLSEPAWGGDLGGARPLAAALLEEPAFDDGVSVMVEFAEPSGEFHTLSVYIDHNLGGLVKDVFLAGRLAEVQATMEQAPDHGRVTFREIELGEARARVEAALYILDHTMDPPVDDSVPALQALIAARMRLLPDGFEVPDSYVEMTLEERDALQDDFLASAEGRRWRGDEDAEYAARLAIDFGADYNHGGPLRWSAVVVEIFMVDWLARKVTEEPAFYARVPEVLTDWLRYAGRRRGVPQELLDEVIAAVATYREEMLATVEDPQAWGPAKAFAAAAEEAGVDLTDPGAVERYIQRYNEGFSA